MKRRGAVFKTLMAVVICLVLAMLTVPVLAAPADNSPTGATDAIEPVPADTPADTPLGGSGIVIPTIFSVIVGGLAYGAAEALKKATSIKKEKIPLILAGIGGFLGILIALFVPGVRIDVNASWQDVGCVIFCGIIYGIMAAWGAVGGNQTLKQGEKLKNAAASNDLAAYAPLTIDSIDEDSENQGEEDLDGEGTDEDGAAQ